MPGGPAHPAALTLLRWSVAEWLDNEPVWRRLLARSNADALFLSWEWQTLWWECFGGALSATPDIMAFHRGSELVGIAPFYRRRVVRRGLVPARSVQLIGLSWRDSGPMISEYLDVVAVTEETDAVRSACAQVLLQDRAWTEWVIGFTAASMEWSAAFSGLGARPRPYVRVVDGMMSYQADLSQGFAAYLRSLGQSARRSMWSLRRRLAAQGQVRFELVAPEQIDSGFNDLNRLHQLRWRRPAFTGSALQFHRRLAHRLASRGELALSRLRMGDEAVSVLYDIRKGARQYNISLGFNPAFSSKLSLGLVHFGYALEAAADSRIGIYDFLGGGGQRSDYKRHLSQAHSTLGCVQVLRGHLLPSLYRWHDRVP